MNKKPRTTYVTMDMGKPVAVNGLRLASDGSFELLQNGNSIVPESAYHITHYEKGLGQKILNRTPIEPNELLSDQNIALLKYDKIFAIDTNTKKINGEYVSISGIVFCSLKRDSNHNAIAEYAPIHCLEFRNIKQQAENIAWMKAIQYMINNPQYNPIHKIGIIVDSDLGNIPYYNKRVKPIYSYFYLPHNFEFVYATTDAGKEYLANKLISLCDKEAKGLLKQIELNIINNDNLQVVSGEPYTHFRLWNKSANRKNT